LILVTWLLSLVTREYSWVDRIWSIAPFVYLWIFFDHSHDNTNVLLMSVVVTAWGLRLTFNFARKGGYSGTEDYRWGVLRSSMSPARFQLFNLMFISIYQNILLLLIALPGYSALRAEHTALRPWVLVLAIAFLLATTLETVADQQQWSFQQGKAARTARGEDGPQFCTTGLFATSRHPNFFFELTQWWLLFLMGAVAAGSVVQWTVLGPVLLTALFVGSTRFTEQITLSKYPEYAQYQSTTSAVVPWRTRRAPRVTPVATEPAD
jgi:steroid 5-alpha reductase family enzyme